jgi:hypothetical protein
LKDKLFEGLQVLKEKYPPHRRTKIESMGTNEDSTENGEQEDSSDKWEQSSEIPQSSKNEPVCGGGKSFSEVSNDSEPNGRNYERKGFTNMFRCLDCELLSFQTDIEDHKCPAWPPDKKEQSNLDPEEWILDK